MLEGTLSEWAACLPGNTGCTYTLRGSGQLLKASFFFFYHRKIKVRAATPPPEQSCWKDTARSRR